MIFFLALRNIIRNKKNNAIIGLLIAIITFIFFIGNSVIGMIDRGIRHAYIESLTGDVVLEKTGDVTMNLFGANVPVIDSSFTIPALPAYNEIMELVSGEEAVANITSQISGKAYLDLLNTREPVLLCGIDPDSHFSLFPGIILTEGRFLYSGEYGAMITEERAQRIEMRTRERPIAGSPLLLTTGSAIGFKIREVPLVGIFKYKNPGQFMNEIVIADPQTVRVLNSIQLASDTAASEKSVQLLTTDLEDLFGEEFATNEETEEAEFSTELLRDYLTESKTVQEIGGSWNFILLRLKDGVSARAFISSLNKKLQPYGVTAVNWRTAAGISAIIMLLIQILFNSGVFLVCVAGIIAVINILLITVFRRTREIGTLRAIGASDTYIRSLMFSENLLIALIAGLIGIAGGILFLFWVNSLGLSVSNELIISILGSRVLAFEFLPKTAVISFSMAVLFALAASVYPVEVTVRIKPIVAVQRG